MNKRAYIGAFVIAIAGILFWTLVMPLYDKVKANREALAERTALLEGRGAIIANIKTLTKQYTEHASDVERFASIVPPQKSAAEIVSALQALATQNGVQLTTLAVGPTLGQTQNPYEDQTVDLGVNGSYPAFKSFLESLEKNIRVIDITSIDASPTVENSPIIGFRVKGTAYFLK
jgi:Tfp pilus assembly protein PilO